MLNVLNNNNNNNKKNKISYSLIFFKIIPIMIFCILIFITFKKKKTIIDFLFLKHFIKNYYPKEIFKKK